MHYYKPPLIYAPPTTSTVCVANPQLPCVAKLQILQLLIGGVTRGEITMTIGIGSPLKLITSKAARCFIINLYYLLSDAPGYAKAK